MWVSFALNKHTYDPKSFKENLVLNLYCYYLLSLKKYGFITIKPLSEPMHLTSVIHWGVSFATFHLKLPYFQFIAYMPSNAFWNIVNFTLSNKLQWNFNQNSHTYNQQNPFENVVWEMVAILSQPQYVNDFPHRCDIVCWYSITNRPHGLLEMWSYAGFYHL